MKKPQANYFLIITFIFLVAIIFAWEQIESVRLQYKIDRFSEALQKEHETQSELQILCYKMESPERLDKLAREMKFVIPKKESIVFAGNI
ncbi:MAG: hypothetical protein A2297_08590 [Elusimicrobia bacterium RIFOXYB2_FULL_48_7]|nr:MAG: hypothetical protein A2297_08590 [Elusimicrobia bacterium RIFOXYB2_FULL_48_7]